MLLEGWIALGLLIVVLGVIFAYAVFQFNRAEKWKMRAHYERRKAKRIKNSSTARRHW